MNVLEQLKEDIINASELEVFFYKASQELMNNFLLCITDNDIELCEIEFYYYADNHKDEKTLKHEKQKTVTQLFFHEFGIDLTFGCKNFYGGILIRGIKYNGKYIAGPENVKKYLQEKINDLENQSINFKKNIFTDTILHSTRKMGNKTNQGFAKKLYRFAKEDYLNGSPTKDFIKKSLPEVSYFKVISNLTDLYDLVYKSDENNALKTIQNDNELMKNIKNFKRAYSN